MTKQDTKKPGWLDERSVAFWTVIGGVVAVISLIVTLVTIFKGQSSANSATHTGSSSQATGIHTGSPSSTPAPSGAPTPSLTSTQADAVNVTQTLLDNALLSTQALGSATAVIYTSTDLSKVAEICGGKPPAGAQLTTGHIFQNIPNGTLFAEGITDYKSTSEAAQLVADDINATGQIGCNYSNNGNTEQYGGANSVPLPQDCANGSSLETTASFGEYSGEHIEVACGTFTITVEYLTNVPVPGSPDTADGYLNNLVGRLMKSASSGG